MAAVGVVIFSERLEEPALPCWRRRGLSKAIRIVVMQTRIRLVVRQNEIVSSHEVKSRANLSRPVVVAAQWVNQHEIMLGFEAVQESILT